MKGVYGAFLLFLAGGVLIGYVPKPDANQWVICGLFILAAWGFEMAVEGMIENKLEKFKEEILEEMRS